MATFQYIAKDSEGNETRGQIEAADRNSAIAAVRAQGLLPTAMGEVRSSAAAPAQEKSKAKPKKAPAPAASSGDRRNAALIWRSILSSRNFSRARSRLKS